MKSKQLTLVLKSAGFFYLTAFVNKHVFFRMDLFKSKLPPKFFLTFARSGHNNAACMSQGIFVQLPRTIKY